MTLQELEQAITRWGDSTYLGVYTLRKDGGFIKMVVNGASRADIDEYLKEEYAEHFAEEDWEDEEEENN